MAKPESVPDWYDDLDGSLAEAWRLLVRGAADRRSGFHTPTVASLGRDGRPRARVVVLRGADPQGWMLRFHTDRRSEKFSELLADSRICLTGYDPGRKIQIRIEGRAILHTDDPVADAAWLGSREMSRACYDIQPGPGIALEKANAFSLPSERAETADGRQNFCAVIVQAETLEWLYLASAGHRRAMFWRNGPGIISTWLVP
jgi:pyridoxamine 5'-phosphate oxidase